LDGAAAPAAAAPAEAVKPKKKRGLF
jgi:hypothetical protein